MVLLILLVGCSSQGGTDTDANCGSTGISGTTAKTISRDRAIEIAGPYHPTAKWNATFDPAYKYEWNRDQRQRPVWVMQTLAPSSNLTLWIDAETEEILIARQSEAAAPPAGG